MPTPFMHLDFAEELRVHAQLLPAVKQEIERELPAFYLGNIAADYQVICDIPREATHFYPLPPPAGLQAHEAMLAAYPQLAEAGRLSPAQRIFIAGYAFHLIQDMNWYWHVLMPYFVNSNKWPADRRYRFIRHNALLTYLDQMALGRLPPDIDQCLAVAAYRGWLPFAADQDLLRWQDMIAGQLRPEGNIETATIYARRMGLPAGEFIANLNDPAWMQVNIFDLVPVAAVQDVLLRGNEEAVQFINHYLEPTATREVA